MRLSFWFVGCLLLLACAQHVHAGFGITPPYVRNDRLGQGSEFTQEIILVRGDPVEDLKAIITLNVPGIESWFSVDRGLEFIMPAGETKVPIKVTVRVPPDTPYDRYTGSIRIRTESPTLSPGVSIALGAQVDVDLRVVDRVLDFDVKRVQLSETEEPRRRLWLEYPGKINFIMTINNTGNGDVAPSKVVFSIYDKRGVVLLEAVENTNAITTVPPFETQAVAAHLPTRLPPGAYLVKYEIYLFETVKREGELTLSVLPSGTIENYEGYGFMGLSLSHKLSLVVPPVILIFLIFAAWTAIRVVRRSRREVRYRPPRDEGGDSSQDNDRAPLRSGYERDSSPTRTPRRIERGVHGVVDLSRKR